MKAIISIWKTITDTLSVVGQYSHAYLYPLLSFAIMLLLTFTVMIPLLDRVVGLAHEAGPTRAFFFLVIFLALLDLMGLTMYSVLRIAYLLGLRNTQYAILSLYPTNSQRAIFFMYGVLYLVTTFFNVALLTGIAGRLDGDAPSFSQGISAAIQRLGPIARYTVVSAMLGLIAIVGKVLTNPFLRN